MDHYAGATQIQEHMQLQIKLVTCVVQEGTAHVSWAPSTSSQPPKAATVAAPPFDTIVYTALLHRFDVKLMKRKRYYFKPKKQGGLTAPSNLHE